MSEFCGNSNSAPEIAAVSALLLQAGLTPAEIENAIQTDSTNPASPGQWTGAWGYGIMNPVAALEQYATLPQPAIEEGASESTSVGTPLSLTGLCNQPRNLTVTGYAWNFGNGSTAATADVNPSWNQPGIYTVTFNCTDSQNLSGVTPATMRVTVTQPGGSSSGSGGFGLPDLLVLMLAAGCARRRRKRGALA
ncbi:serine protease, subtilase family [mine drainage metagenome]|uniref:Serine protease, subtilase family n=1 Tax=mine drainage metagenome TaxID=410659 RepID=T0ZNP6_9ZZZZ